MKKKFCGILSLTVFAMYCPSLSFAADKGVSEQEETRKLSTDSWIASGRELLGPSWSKNPKKLDSYPSPLLYQFTANYSYFGQDGNIVTENHNASAELILRKQLVTSISKYELSKGDTEMALSGFFINTNSEYFFQVFKYPVADWIQIIVGGAVKTEDSAIYLDERIGYFGGMSFDAVDSPALSLTCSLSYGHISMSYMNDTVIEDMLFRTLLNPEAGEPDFTPVDDYDTDDIYLTQNLRWNITDTVTFTEDAEYAQFLKDTDYFFWRLKMGLEFGLTEHISFTTSYQMSYQYTNFTEAVQDYLDEQKALGKSAGELDEMDTSLAVGLTVSF